MSPIGAWRNQHWFQSLVGGWRLYGPSRFIVDLTGPSDAVNKRLCGNKLAGLAIEHVKEAVLRRLHDDFARGSVDLQIREH